MVLAANGRAFSDVIIKSVTNFLNSSILNKSILDFAIKMTNVVAIVEMQSLLSKPMPSLLESGEFSQPTELRPEVRTYRNCLRND